MTIVMIVENVVNDCDDCDATYIALCGPEHTQAANEAMRARRRVRRMTKRPTPSPMILAPSTSLPPV